MLMYILLLLCSRSENISVATKDANIWQRRIKQSMCSDLRACESLVEIVANMGVYIFVYQPVNIIFTFTQQQLSTYFHIGRFDLISILFKC